MQKILQLIRIREWFFSKIPFMFIPLFLFLYREGAAGERKSLLLAATYFVYLFFFFSFGYAINDYSDREIDRKVGKTNIMNELTEWQCRSVLALLIAGCLPMLALYFSPYLLLLFIFVYFWGAAYSVRPFRFKERGAAGLLVSSLAQRTIPLFPLLGISEGLWKMVCVWGALGFLVGLRYILIHQAEDLENDIKSGTRTFVKKNGGSVRLLIYLCLGLEGIFLLLLFLWNLKAGWQLALLAVYLPQLCIAGGTIRFIYKENWLTSFLCVPLEDLYNFYLPLILLLALAAGNAAWLLPLLVLLLIGWRPMLEKWKIVIFGITHWKGFRS